MAGLVRVRRASPNVSGVNIAVVAVLLMKAAKLTKGSGEPNRTKVGSVTAGQVREIARLKIPDLNAASEEAAVRMIEGTARSMGIDIV